MKGKFKHYFTHQKIYEQRESITKTVRGRVSFGTNKIILGGLLAYRILITNRFRSLVFFACGKSYYSCFTWQHILSSKSYFLHRNTPIFRDDVCVFVS